MLVPLLLLLILGGVQSASVDHTDPQILPLWLHNWLKRWITFVVHHNCLGPSMSAPERMQKIWDMALQVVCLYTALVDNVAVHYPQSVQPSHGLQRKLINVTKEDSKRLPTNIKVALERGVVGEAIFRRLMRDLTDPMAPAQCTVATTRFFALEPRRAGNILWSLCAYRLSVSYPMVTAMRSLPIIKSKALSTNYVMASKSYIMTMVALRQSELMARHVNQAAHMPYLTFFEWLESEYRNELWFQHLDCALPALKTSTTPWIFATEISLRRIKQTLSRSHGEFHNRHCLAFCNINN